MQVPLKVEHDVESDGEELGLWNRCLHELVILLDKTVNRLLEAFINQGKFEVQLLLCLQSLRVVVGLLCFKDLGLVSRLDLLLHRLSFLLKFVEVSLEAEEAFFEVFGEDGLDGSLFRLQLMAYVASFAQLVEEALLLFFALAHYFVEDGPEVVVFDQVCVV